MLKELVDFINKELSAANAILEERENGDSPVFVDPTSILEVSKLLRDSSEYQMNVLQVITGCDYADRIEVSYVLASFIFNTELILKVKLPKTDSGDVQELDSICDIWKSANFQERECYDMLGVVFRNHPDLRRILCPEDWEGFPLRKDYQVAKTYRGMEINPIRKMNIDDKIFAKEFKEKAEDPKTVSFSWDYDRLPVSRPS